MLLLIVLTSVLLVDAFWRLLCYLRLGVFRIDPIVFLGVPLGHAHTLYSAQSKFIHNVLVIF
jgi:hypothetical protein